ncbi:hypothetical protein TorRG33x02_292340 [Trema orientale]|uniref:RNase H type-1 domain-containing protein n=1 Tax=Trema orientale TaxID=63057 RepID=A0A2P5CAF5_TREOI|nr:hypothetical protein TorRG33x02_292340 [Trema orientale]
MVDVNQALLGKWGWGLLTNRVSLCMQVSKSKYLGHETFLNTPVPNCASWTWKNFCKSRNLIQKGAYHFNGDERSTIIWEHPWVPGVEDFKPIPKGSPCHGNFLVADFILADSTWDYPKLVATFNAQRASDIACVTLPSFPQRDSWIWSSSPNGKFSTKLAYLTDQKDCAISFGQAVASISECPAVALWEHPPEDRCKINFDNSIQKDVLTVAAICLDSTGSVLGIETKLHPHTSSVIGECLAAKLAISLKISHLILEGDSLVAIQSLMMGPDLCQ